MRFYKGDITAVAVIYLSGVTIKKREISLNSWSPYTYLLT